MLGKISVLMHKRGFLLGLSLLAVLSFNNWLLGPFLNNKLFVREGAISEFSAVTQPHYWVFRGLDIISGFLLVCLALTISRQITRSAKVHDLLVGGILVLGTANVIDALFTLPCSETLDTACKIPVDISLNHLQIPGHGWSSIIIAICYFVLPLAGYAYALTRKNYQLMILSALAVIIALESFLSVLSQLVLDHTYSIKAGGVGQEIQMLILGFWFILLAWSAYTNKVIATADAKKSTKPTAAKDLLTSRS